MKNNAVVQFCIDECKRQNDYTLESVGAMVEAWYYTLENYSLTGLTNILTINDIEYLGKIIKPQNIGFRYTPVTFSNGTFGAPHHAIPRLISNLCDARFNLTPDEFYYEFEKIHPFEDGNGRVGAIVWNFMNGNIENPICPPDMF